MIVSPTKRRINEAVRCRGEGEERKSECMYDLEDVSLIEKERKKDGGLTDGMREAGNREKRRKKCMMVRSGCYRSK